MPRYTCSLCGLVLLVAKKGTMWICPGTCPSPLCPMCGSLMMFEECEEPDEEDEEADTG